MSLNQPFPPNFMLRERTSVLQYLAVGLVSGAIIALQICIMRVFAVGSFAHFGSLVVSLAMLGFSFASVVICLAREWFERHWRGAAAAALTSFGPLMVGANLLAQLIPFDAIFLISDPAQKWRLLANFALYFVPFLTGALFLGTIFLNKQRTFGRIYFADLAGSGLSGLVVLAAMYVVAPENLIIVPLLLWSIGGVLWFAGLARWRGAGWQALVALASVASYLLMPVFGIPKLAVSPYKGIAYARNYPDSRRIYRNISPFGDLQIYSSSYMHFAPGLSDNAAFNLPEVPSDAYLGMFIDGDGPDGIMRSLPAAQTAYFRFLPMSYPYVIKANPNTFVVQLGGGISAMVALRSNSKTVAVAESNPAILEAFRDSSLRDFTGKILDDPRVRVIPYFGRLFLAGARDRFDVIDLSLADSVGLSNPGGFAIVEKYAYTREAIVAYMRALRPDGVLSVTLWNKEEPPKSVLKLYATMAEAAREIDAHDIGNSFFVVSSYLATTTVLYKRDGFTADEIARLRDRTRMLSFDEIYYPGFEHDPNESAPILDGYEKSIFGERAAAEVGAAITGNARPPGADAGAPDDTGNATALEPQSVVLPATAIGRLAWHVLIHGGWDAFAQRYVFDTRMLTDDRPYFAAYVKFVDLARVLDRLDLLQDDWGYFLVWATFIIACAGAALLVLIPVMFAGRLALIRSPGKIGTIVYFACLGAGYIMVEVGLIGRFIVVLSNATISASVLITGMLVFSGLGSLVSERILGRRRFVLPCMLAAIGVILIGYGFAAERVFDWIGTYPYALRLLSCFALLAPPAFLMGFPMPTAMTSLAQLGKSDMFVWAWGINGCFSVVGAASVPIIATAFGLDAVLQSSGVAYLVAIPAFFALLLPTRGARISTHVGSAPYAGAGETSINTR